ncbi:uncharacterized protein LOC129579403 [Sitodiplosis mosellana]|uniref:uncharacterized protein LOC129579403 n=1 Tax=Sitodiplosis mosellana TaxID=263140 RepID=UPI0024441680|nr:uncharacterized protein LOC129579403 [Sitodiplosis mosellana]
MFISVLVTFASTTVKIYLEFSENEFFEKMKGIVAILLVISASLSSADVSHLTNAQYNDDSITTSTPPPPPHPYEFSYKAGRFPGHVDRTHAEVSDGSGVVRGAFSYVDPRNEIRSVEYTADKYGFHPVLSHQDDAPHQSEAVKQATIRHFEQYNRIAEQNANGNIVVPSDSAAVARAKDRHFTLFEQIAQEHQRLGAELEAKRALFESTSEQPIEQPGFDIRHQ